MLADGGPNPCARVDAASATAAALLLPVGVRHVCGAPYLVLEDLTGQYSQPCILDVKVRARTAAALDLVCHCNVDSASSPR
jgi:hypothetical protein